MPPATAWRRSSRSFLPSAPLTKTSTTRRYAVGYIRDHRQFEPSPAITFKGHWMATLGFSTGQMIEVITGPGELIIRLAGEG